MSAIPKTKQVEAEPLLVPAKAIARELSCTPRFVHMLHEQGKIPAVRFGKACIRFNKSDVFAALGIKTVEAAQ
jgi:excisionase family DNA binding protein